MGQNGGFTSHFMFKHVGLVGSIHLCPMTGQCERLYLLYILYLLYLLYPLATDTYPYKTVCTPVSYLGPIVIRSHSSNKGDWTTKNDLSSNQQIRNSRNSYTSACSRATGYLQARLRVC